MPVARDPLRLDDLAARERGGADVADLALVHEVAERRQRLLDVGARIGAVDLVEVDPVGAQPPQRVLDRAHDPAARAALLVGVLAHRAVELGGEDDVVAPAAGERLADDLLGLALPVDVGGVDEVDPGVERRVDDPDRLVVIGVAPRAEHHRAEAELADGDAGASQLAMLHGCSSSPRHCVGLGHRCLRRSRSSAQGRRGDGVGDLDDVAAKGDGVDVGRGEGAVASSDRDRARRAEAARDRADRSVRVDAPDVPGAVRGDERRPAASIARPSRSESAAAKGRPGVRGDGLGRAMSTCSDRRPRERLRGVTGSCRCGRLRDRWPTAPWPSADARCHPR